MQRRDFLQWMSVGAAGGVPLFVFGCGKDDGLESGTVAAGPEPDLRAALQHAKQVGKPLLVLAIPDDRAERWEREKDLGRWLNFAPDSMLADLALVEVACVPTSALRAMSVSGVSDTASMHLIGTPGDSDQPRAIEVAKWAAADGAGDDPLMIDIDANCRARIHALHDPFRAALEHSMPLAGDTARTDDERAALALEAKRRLRERAPPGSCWAYLRPCGVELEGEPEPTDPDAPLPACGTSSIEVHSERFLHFLTREPN